MPIDEKGAETTLKNC